MCDFSLPDINWGSIAAAAVGAGIAAAAPKPDYSAALKNSQASTSAALDAIRLQNEKLADARNATASINDSASAQAAADAARRRSAKRPKTTYAGDSLEAAPVAVKYLTGE